MAVECVNGLTYATSPTNTIIISSQMSNLIIYVKNDVAKEPEKIIDYIDLGDSGYPLRQYFLTPIHHLAEKAEKNQNKAYKKARSLIDYNWELKNRFRYRTKHGISTKPCHH